jgi:hypothetical protein
MIIKNGVDMMQYYENEVSKNVVGWIYPLDILSIFHLLKGKENELKGDICELGVAFGKSAVLLSLLRSEGEKFYMYDLYEHENVLSNITNYGNAKDIKLNILDLMKLDKNDIVFEKKLKLLHVDACHFHTSLLNDLNNFHEHVCDNGIIVVDDINDVQYPGINTAVTEFCLMNKQWKMFAIGDNKVYLAREHHVKDYIKFLLKYFRDQLNYKNFTFSEVMGVDLLLLKSREPVDDEVAESYLQDKFTRKYE